MADSAPPSAQAKIATEIVAVTVYPQQAQVVRRGQMTVTPAQTLLVVEDLPVTLQADSLQVRPEGTAQVLLQQPQVEKVIASRSQGEDGGPDPHQQLQALEVAFRTCKDRLAALNLQQTFLESFAERSPKTLAVGLSRQATTLSDVAQVLQFLDQSYQQVTTAIAQQERLKHELDQQLQAARQAVQAARAASPLQGYRVVLPMQVQQAGNLSLELIYVVDQATWTPAYELRLECDRARLGLDCIAEVRQTTGESWQGVMLQVSTALPSQTPEVPQPGLWRLHPSQTNGAAEGRYVSAPRIKTRSPILDDAYRMLGAVPGSEIPPADVEAAVTRSATVRFANATLCLPASSPATVLSNDVVHRIPVGHRHLTGQFSYIAMPQQASAAYLQLQLTNPPGQYPLLSGTADVFRAGAYVGRANLAYVASGESFVVSLGVDERISLQRELVTQETQRDNRCRNLRAYRLVLRNPLPEPIDISVIEQVPVSQSEEIQISLLGATPEITASQPGFYRWMLRLAPQAMQEIHYQYVVEHPIDTPVVGLEGSDPEVR